MDQRRTEALTYLCRQLDLAADIGPRTWRAFLETTAAIDTEATFARLRLGDLTIVLWDGAWLRWCARRDVWLYLEDGEETSAEDEGPEGLALSMGRRQPSSTS